MMKTLNDIKKQEKRPFKIPRSIQDIIPIQRIWKDGICQVGQTSYSQTWKYTDVNYMVASPEDQETMFLKYSSLLNSMDSGSVAKITINNHRMNQVDWEKAITIPLRGDERDQYRTEYNQAIMEKAVGDSGLVQEKYITITTFKREVDAARTYLSRVGAGLSSHFATLGSRCNALDAESKLRIFHDFYQPGLESSYHFSLEQSMAKGHDFRDYIAPQSIVRHKDYLEIGDQFCRVLYLKEYASFLKDDMVTRLTDLSRSLMLSIDFIPVPMEEAIKEAESRVMGVETNIHNWQRKQNQNNNFSATLPYDMELQRKEANDFLDDMRTRNQRMMLSILTLAITADSKEQLDNDTEEILSIGQEYLCQFATMTYQQTDALNTALPFGVRHVTPYRTLNTESLAIFMPFKVQEVQEPGGLYLGVNAISQNLILCNRSNLKNQAAFLLGVPGSGKSFIAKELIVPLILGTEDDILICDPEGEFCHLCRALGAEQTTVIQMAAGGKDRLNAMYMVEGYGEKNPIVSKSQFIMSLVQQLDKNGVGPQHKSIIDRCVATVYEEADRNGRVCTLCDLRQKLLEQPESIAQDIALTLELFTTGTLDIFGKESNVDLENRILVFDIHELSEQLKTVGLMIVTDTILNRVNINWKRGKRTHIFIDEFHVVFGNEQGANFFDSAWRQFRKRGAHPAAITQNVEYLLGSPVARMMLSNSECNIMLSQAASDRQELASLLHISDDQMSFCTNTQPGCGLLKYGSAIVPFENRFPQNTKLYELMTTKPGEGVFGGGGNA